MRFHYAVVDSETGEVLRAGWCHRQSLADAQPVEAGELLVRGEWAVGEHLLGDAPPPPEVGARQIKEHVGRLLSYTDGYVIRAAEPGGKPIPEHVLEYRRAVRQRGNDIEAMQPIPADYHDVKYWPNELEA